MGLFFKNKITRDVQKQEDYSKLTNDEILDRFKSQNWNRIETNKEKIALLQEIENRNARLNGREPARVKEIMDPSLLGSYHGYTNTISIRLVDNPYENLDSVIHEGQHANHEFSTTNYTNISKEDKMLIDLEKYPSVNSKESFYSYYQDANSQDLYDIYSSELNTNNTAFSFLKSQESRYGDDEKYKEYIQDRNEHYNKVYDELNSLSEAKKEAILETSQASYEREWLSEEEYQSIVEYTNEEHIDSFEQTAIENHYTLNEMVEEQQSSLYEEEQYTYEETYTEITHYEETHIEEYTQETGTSYSHEEEYSSDYDYDYDYE